MNHRIVYKGFAEILTAENGHEIARTSDAVAVFVYDTVRRGAYFVRQQRTAMVIAGVGDGFIIEIPAGRFDREVGPVALAAAEIREELGIAVREDQIRLLNGGEPLAAAPGYLTERIYLAYAEVTPDQAAPEGKFGCADEGESTERVFIPLDNLSSLQVADMKTFALIQWFLRGIFGKRPL